MFFTRRLILSCFIIWQLAFLLPVDATVEFVVDKPLPNSVWPLGSWMSIHWHMNNVSAPFPDLSIQIDLYANGAFYRQIATDVPNTELFNWTVPFDVDSVAGPFQIRVNGFDQRTRQRQEPGQSQSFQLVDVLGGNAAFYIQQPVAHTIVYPNQHLDIQVTQLSTLAQLPHGVQLELRPHQEAALQLIESDLHFEDGYHAVTSWTVPFIESGGLSIQADLVVWGWDTLNQRLLLSRSPILIDQSDTIAYTLNTRSPNQQTVWLTGTTVDWTFQLVSSIDPNVVQSRDVRLASVHLLDDQTRLRLELLKDVSIPVSQWQAGTNVIRISLPKTLPDPIEPNQLMQRSSGEDQRVFKAAEEGKFQLNVKGIYRGHDGVERPFESVSSLFTIQKGTEPSLAVQSYYLERCWFNLSIVMALLFVLV